MACGLLRLRMPTTLSRSIVQRDHPGAETASLSERVMNEQEIS